MVSAHLEVGGTVFRLQSVRAVIVQLMGLDESRYFSSYISLASRLLSVNVCI